jgi:hypothetical protein
MLGNPSALQIAERIFARVGREGASSDDAIAALTSVYERLELAMSAVLGDEGYRAMFARCMRKAKAGNPCLQGVLLADSPRFLVPLYTRLRQENALTIQNTGAALMTHFIELLVTLIGNDLTLKLFHRVWPDAVDSVETL